MGKVVVLPRGSDARPAAHARPAVRHLGGRAQPRPRPWCPRSRPGGAQRHRRRQRGARLPDGATVRIGAAHELTRQHCCGREHGQPEGRRTRRWRPGLRFTALVDTLWLTPSGTASRPPGQRHAAPPTAATPRRAGPATRRRVGAICATPRHVPRPPRRRAGGWARYAPRPGTFRAHLATWAWRVGAVCATCWHVPRPRRHLGLEGGRDVCHALARFAPNSPLGPGGWAR